VIEFASKTSSNGPVVGFKPYIRKASTTWFTTNFLKFAERFYLFKWRLGHIFIAVSAGQLFDQK